MNAHERHKAVMNQVRAEEAAGRARLEAEAAAWLAESTARAGGPKRCEGCGERFGCKWGESASDYRRRRSCSAKCAGVCRAERDGHYTGTGR